MPGWVPTNSFFSSGAAFLSLAPSIAKGYYATDSEADDSRRHEAATVHARRVDDLIAYCQIVLLVRLHLPR